MEDAQQDLVAAVLAAQASELDEPWFSEAPASSRRMSSCPPPVVHVGEFLGDPEVDAWLR
jgi:hypothetical protein